MQLRLVVGLFLQVDLGRVSEALLGHDGCYSAVLIDLRDAGICCECTRGRSLEDRRSEKESDIDTKGAGEKEMPMETA